MHKGAAIIDNVKMEQPGLSGSLCFSESKKIEVYNIFITKISLFFLLFLLFFKKSIYEWLDFRRHGQFHITTSQRVIRIMHYSPTLRHMPAPAVCTLTLAEGVHRGDL